MRDRKQYMKSSYAKYWINARNLIYGTMPYDLSMIDKIDEISNDYENEYEEMLHFIDNLEQLRINPSNFNILKRKIYWQFYKILQKNEILMNTAKIVYYQYLRRKSK